VDLAKSSEISKRVVEVEFEILSPSYPQRVVHTLLTEKICRKSTVNCKKSMQVSVAPVGRV